MSTHILYLTSRCNFACSYCYEHKSNGKCANELFDLDLESAKRAIDGMIEQDGDNQTCAVLFGGEPTLNWDVLRDAVLYGFSKKKNIRFCMSTNAWRFRSMKFCLECAELVKQVSGQFTIEVSFDGLGNGSRTLLNGKSTAEGILAAISNIKKAGLNYHLRYTVHQGNANIAADDLENIARYLKPSRIVPSYDTTNIGEAKESEVKAALRNKYLEGKITIPVCELVCDVCKICTQNREIDTLTYWANDKLRSIKTASNATEFKDF